MRRLVAHLVDGLVVGLTVVIPVLGIAIGFAAGAIYLVIVCVLANVMLFAWALVFTAIALICLGILALFVLALDAAGAEVGTLWDLETGSTRLPLVPGPYLAGAATLAVVVETIRRLHRWYISCREEAPWPGREALRRSRPVLRRIARAHPVGSGITLLAAILPMAALFVVGALQRYDQAHMALILEQATARGLDPGRAECMAVAMVDQFSPTEDIDTTAIDEATQSTYLELPRVRQMVGLSLACRGVAHPGAMECLLDELVVKEAVGTWERPLDALFPFETGALDRQQLERALEECDAGGT